jgi:hypothetical protein
MGGWRVGWINGWQSNPLELPQAAARSLWFSAQTLF